MTDSTLTLAAQRDEIMTTVRNLAAKCETESRDFSDDERSQVTDLLSKGRELQRQITKAKVDKTLHTDIAEFLSDAEAHQLNAAHVDAPTYAGARRIKALGEYFTESEQFKASVAAFKGRDIPQGHQYRTDPVEIAGGLKALLGTDPLGDNTGIGQLYDPQRLGLVSTGFAPLSMRNIITVGSTTSDSIKYARQLRVGNSPTANSQNNAAGVPEATTAAPIGSGDPAVTPVQAGLKPESAIRFEVATADVVTIAHWIPATKKALSDAGQLRTLIDNFLRAGLNAEVERQVIFGDSDAGEEVDGLLNTSGVQAQSFNTNILVTIRKAITKVRKYGQPNAILVSPNNAERIDLLRTSTGSYLGPGAFGPAIPSVWRLPLVEVASLTDNQVLVGDFKTAVLWDREAVTITATDSHADFFTRNLVAILAEARAAFGVLDPALIAVANVVGDDDIVPAVAAA